MNISFDVNFLLSKTKFQIVALLFFLTVTDFGYSQLATENFNSGIPSAWAITSNTAVTNNWVPTATGGLQSTGAATVDPASNNTVGSTAEYFFISPQFVTPTNGEIRFFTKQGSFANRGTIYQLRISTAYQPDVSGFNVVLQSWNETQLNVSATTYEEKIVPIPTIQAGIPVYIAFVAITNQTGTFGTAGDNWFVDDVRVNSACVSVTAPTAVAQTFCASSTVANLVATGTAIKWYAALTGGTALASSTALVTGTTYYASQTVGTCESTRTAVNITVNPLVTPTFTQIVPVCRGTTITPLPTTSTNGITGTWSPVLNNTTTTTYTFTPTAGQCANTTTLTLTVSNPSITSAISFVATPAAALPSVTIGTQIWTNKNLDVTTYRDGTLIPQVTDPTQWGNLTTGAWCYYNNDPANGAIYGKLYNWYAVAGIHDNDPNTPNKILAPLGWHVPSDIEWTTLTDFLGGDSIVGNKMKATTLWQPYSGITNTNSSGFTGLPGGYCNNDGTFYNVGSFGFWWSSSQYYPTGAWYRLLNYWNGSVTRNFYSNTDGFSVRCLKD
jgi:uncharacterized protein (TIGR02145 family)